MFNHLSISFRLENCSHGNTSSTPVSTQHVWLIRLIIKSYQQLGTTLVFITYYNLIIVLFCLVSRTFVCLLCIIFTNKWLFMIPSYSYSVYKLSTFVFLFSASSNGILNRTKSFFWKMFVFVYVFHFISSEISFLLLYRQGEKDGGFCV